MPTNTEHSGSHPNVAVPARRALPGTRLANPLIDWGTYLNYKYFNNVSGLTAGFKTKADSGYLDADTFNDLNTNPSQALYCTDITRHAYLPTTGKDGTLNQSTTPTPNITPEMIPMLTYILNNGAQIADIDLSTGGATGNYPLQELQIATQLAVWLVVEGVYSCSNLNSDAVKAVLGDGTPGKNQFAVTAEIGQQARQLLAAACANGTNAPPLYPSFTSTSAASAPSYNMPASGALTIPDANNAVMNNPGALRVVDNAGLGVTLTSNGIRITGDPGPECKTITLSSTNAPGTIYYLSSPDTSDKGDPYQRQMRYIQNSQTAVPIYVRVCRASEPPTPGTGSVTLGKSLAPDGINDPAITGQTFTFHLYGRDSNNVTTDYGTKTVTAGQQVTFDNLPLGQIYSFTEDTPLSNSNWQYQFSSVPSAGMLLENWTTLLSENHLASNIGVENRYTPSGGPTPGSLTFTKSVTPPGAAAAMSDNYELELVGTSADGTTISYFGTVGANGSYTFTNLPTDALYTLVESNQAIPGYSFTGATVNGVALDQWNTTVSSTTPGSAAVTNNYTPNTPGTGSISMTKSVNPAEAGIGQSYTFQLTGVTSSGTVLPPQTITLEPGQTYTFSDLTLGATYTVTETTPGSTADWRYTYTEMDNQRGRTWTGTLTDANSALSVDTANHYVEIPPPPPPVTGSVSVMKRADPPEASDGQTYTFRLTGVTDDGTVLPPQTITVPANQLYTFGNLTVGATYTVTEVLPGNVDGWTYAFTDFDGVAGLSTNIPLTRGTPNQSTTATNHYNADMPKFGAITLHKCCCPPGASGGGDFTFTLSGTSASTGTILPPITRSVGEDGTVTFDNLPLDFVYRLEESAPAGAAGYTLASSTVNGVPLSQWLLTLTNSNQIGTVNVTNNYNLECNPCNPNPYCQNRPTYHFGPCRPRRCC